MGIKNSKPALEISLENIKILSYDEIFDIFGKTEKDIKNGLKKSNSSENYWYPYDENCFDEEIIKIIVSLFRKKFLDAEILDIHGYEYTEIFLNTIDKHVFAFSLIEYITANILKEDPIK
jgi:hypothetical protein